MRGEPRTRLGLVRWQLVTRGESSGCGESTYVIAKRNVGLRKGYENRAQKQPYAMPRSQLGSNGDDPYWVIPDGDARFGYRSGN